MNRTRMNECDGVMEFLGWLINNNDLASYTTSASIDLLVVFNVTFNALFICLIAYLQLT